MIRKIRDLLYEQGFTISGARNRLQDAPASDRSNAEPDGLLTTPSDEARAMQRESLGLAAQNTLAQSRPFGDARGI